MNLLSKYLKLFSHLKRATINGLKAPHKPILLLSVIQSIEKGEILKNQIDISPQLIARFRDNWNLYVKSNLFRPNFFLPFFHLRSDKFWHLKTIIGKEISLSKSLSIGSFAQLKETVAYAFLDMELFELLSSYENRIVAINFLLWHYFNTENIINSDYGLIDEIKKQILNDTPAQYQQHLVFSDDEDIFIRGGIFKKEIPRIYNLTCCISRMRIVTGFNIQMVDACHIIPFSISHDDTITNGITLNPNLHRAFDRGLISIDENYLVRVSNNFSENNNYAGSLNSYAGKSILLPDERKFWPSVNNFKWHQENIFKM